MKRTLKNCRLLKKHSANQHDGVCEGLCASPTNDEPCEVCKNCTLHYLYEKPEPKPRKSKRKFTWDSWDYDFDGDAYIIAQDECPNRQDVPAWIVKSDNLHEDVLNPEKNPYLSVHDVLWGWCKFQVRTDWGDGDGEPQGGYFVEDWELCAAEQHYQLNGKSMPGWFRVWIIRKGEWY